MLCADHLQQMIIRICCPRSASSNIVSRICCRPGRCSSRILRRNGGCIDRYIRYIASASICGITFAAGAVRAANAHIICCRRTVRSIAKAPVCCAQKVCDNFFWFCCPQTRGSTANRPMCCPRTASSRSLRCYAAGRPPAAKWKACAAGRLRAAIARAKDRLPAAKVLHLEAPSPPTAVAMDGAGAQAPPDHPFGRGAGAESCSGGRSSP